MDAGWGWWIAILIPYENENWLAMDIFGTWLEESDSSMYSSYSYCLVTF